MDPIHIFSKELEINQGNTFTANVSQENEVEKLVFNTDKEYAVAGMLIKPDIADSELLKIDTFNEQDRVSKEIQQLIKDYKEPDLSLFISNPESKTVNIPFVKKDDSILPKIKLTYYYTTTKKDEDFLVYDYIGHLEMFRFDWKHDGICLRYGIKIDNSDSKKLKKQLTLSSLRRKKLCYDESRIWNMSWIWLHNKLPLDYSRICFLIGCLENEKIMKSMLGITDLSYDFTSMSITEKTGYLRRYARHFH